MNIKKTILCAVATASAMLMASDTPEVSNVTMTQASFGRQVTITYQLNNAPNGAVVTLDVETNATGNVWASIGGEAVCNAQGAVWRKVTSADADGSGKYTITWRPDLSWEGHKVELANGGARAVVTAWALDNTPDYMVVDISAGAQPNTQRYYPSVEFLPDGLLGNPDYRTTKLVMRKINAKDIEWTMGSTTAETQRNATREATHQVTLTNNYYIGVFPMTQSQWGVVATNSTRTAAFTTEPSMRAMESVCYNEIRNTVNDTAANTTYDWPANPNPSSFLGLLRLKSGLDFDLPSDAQWEFAARAGNGSGYWGDGSSIQNSGSDTNLNQLERYKFNGGMIGSNSSTLPAATCGVENGTAIVGTYRPNSWGLYDMCGNVIEWCLDWYSDNIVAYGGKVNIDPSQPQASLAGGKLGRVRRGGSWYTAADLCRPSYRGYSNPTSRSDDIGFRVVCTAGLQ